MKKVIEMSQKRRNSTMPQAREWPTHMAQYRDEAAAQARRGLRALEPTLNHPEQIPPELRVPIARAISSLHRIDEYMLAAGTTNLPDLNAEPLLYQGSIERKSLAGLPLHYSEE
jgi:hypothetical protein